MVAVLILSVSSSGVTGLWQVSRVPGLCSVALRRLPPQAALPPPRPPLACAAGLTQVSWECSGETGLLPVTPLSGLWQLPQGGRRKTRTSHPATCYQCSSGESLSSI